MMHYRSLKVGDPVPVDPSRGLQGGPELLCSDTGKPRPRWFALLTPPQRERAARAYLRAQGLYGFYPSEIRKWTVRGRWREREFAMVPGTIFVRFTHQPQWDVIASRPFFSGVIGLGGSPYPIPRAQVRLIKGLPVEAEELTRARATLAEAIRHALTPVAGERATIEDGPLAGFVVDVTQVRDGTAKFLLPLSSGGTVPGEARVEVMRREGVDLTKVPGYVSDTAHRDGNG